MSMAGRGTWASGESETFIFDRIPVRRKAQADRLEIFLSLLPAPHLFGLVSLALLWAQHGQHRLSAIAIGRRADLAADSLELHPRIIVWRISRHDAENLVALIIIELHD